MGLELDFQIFLRERGCELVPNGTEERRETLEFTQWCYHRGWKEPGDIARVRQQLAGSAAIVPIPPFCFGHETSLQGPLFLRDAKDL